MKKLQLWSIEPGSTGEVAQPIESVSSAETEAKLEDLLVRCPDLLMSDMVVIGRQVPTEGGPLDLLGVDQDGRVVIFELKRGTLTREAVAQVLDYGSDIANMEPQAFAQLVEDHSGAYGVDAIEDFSDWYNQGHPNADLLGEPPRLVLVGLGVDTRAKRIVEYLADTGLDIQLFAFHGFEVDGRLLLARELEVAASEKTRERSVATKEGNRRVLLETAADLGVKDLLEEVASFIDEQMPAYRWPGKTAYSFSLQETTAQGRPSLRSYVTLYVSPKEPGHLNLVLAPRTAEVAGASAIDKLCAAVTTAKRSHASWKELEIDVTEASWPETAPYFGELLIAIVTGWRAGASSEV